MAKDPNRVRAGKHSRTKGASNERALAKQFKEWWGEGEWARTPSSGGWATPQHREGFRAVGDIMTTDRSFPFCIEAKKQEKWHLEQLLTNDKCIIWEWWQQAVDETPGFMRPLLVIGRNHVKPIAILENKHTSYGMELLWTDKARTFPHFLMPDRYGAKTLIMLSLKNFFEINPDYFGRGTPIEA